MAVKVINSDDLIPIEQHFRVSAGPGAGKTHWLVNHIHNVLYNSKRLTKSKKIACITYTNIGVETILKRLGAVDDKVEVSTIHSFLYKHLVKPYVSFIADEYELNVERMDGHDDTILSNYSFLNEWKQRTRQQRIRDDVGLVNVFREARWKYDSEELLLKTPYPIRVDGYALRNDSLIVYKMMAWRKGILHHDDVLFFSYQLIKKKPFCLNILRAKFPYFFIDEFQDTNPIQTKLLKNIGHAETVIGIIGDRAQSIYKFQGAEPADFSSFDLAGIIDYQILDNRRSTNLIIDVLNNVRNDIRQNPVRKVVGSSPYLIIGNMIDAYGFSKELSSSKELMCLSRNNIIANAMKRQIGSGIPNSDLINNFHSIESNRDRKRAILICLKSIELARENNFSESIKEMGKLFRDISDKKQRKIESLNKIQFLLSNYDQINKMGMLEFFRFVKSNIVENLSELKGSGAIKPFYETHSYIQLALCVRVTEERTPFRTIHKAKGAEFFSVFITLEHEADLSFIIAPNLNATDDEHRIYYVAVSRATDMLFVNVPSLSEGNRKILISKGFSLIEIT